MKKFIFSLLFAVLSLGGAFFAHQTFAAAQIDDTPDCDTVAIVRCGSMSQADVRTNATKGDVSKVYGAFGISQADLNGGFVSGVVWSNGNVTTGNSSTSNIVATGATTAGRWNNPTSDMTRISGTDRAYKMSTSHFVTPGQTAWLKFDANGKFLFAIIKSCGNPVIAKPIIPSYVCNSLTFIPQTRTSYLFTAKATGNHASIVSYTYNFGDGTVITGPNTKPGHTYAKPGTYTATLNVTFKLATNGATKTVSAPSCVKKVTVPPAPTYSCNSLTKAEISRNQYKFTTTSSAANGAKITAHTFDYGDGQKQTIQTVGNNTTQSATHTYAKPGNYTVRATQTVLVEGATKTVTNDKCVVKVTVSAAPTYSCDELKPNKIDRTNYSFVAKASADNGATISKYHFDFGDGKFSDVTTNAKTATAAHNYDKAGDYTIRTTVSVVADGKTVPVTSNNCVTKITVEEKPVPPAYSCDSLTKNQISRTNYGFTANASATNGAVIASYHFDYGDGKTDDKTTAANSVSTTHEFAKAGDYIIKVTANVIVAGVTTPVTSDKCIVKVTVQEEQTPEFECKSLTAVLIGKKEDRTFQYSLNYNVDGGATLKNVDFNFGDQTDVKTFTPAELTNVTHAYAADGEYTTVATLHFNVKDTIQDKKCEVKVNPSNPECKPGIPVGDDRCKPDECQPGIPVGDVRCTECKPGIPAGDVRCTECKPGIPAGDVKCEDCKPGVPKGDAACEEVPQALPSTGPEAIVGSLFGTSALGYGAYSYLASRRAVRNSWKR